LLKWGLILAGVGAAAFGVYWFFFRVDLSDAVQTSIANAVLGPTVVPGRGDKQVSATGSDSPGGVVPPVMTTQKGTGIPSQNVAFPATVAVKRTQTA
jgi:hypothetical protein